MIIYILFFILVIFLICEITLFKNKKNETFYNINKSTKNNKKYIKANNKNIPNNFRNYDKLKIDQFYNHNKCFTCSKKLK